VKLEPAVALRSEQAVSILVDLLDGPRRFNPRPPRSSLQERPWS